MQKISLNKKDKKLSFKTKLILIILASVVFVIGAATFLFLTFFHVYNTYTIAPTCETLGYTESKCIYCGEIKRTHYKDAFGHDFGELTPVSEPSELTFGKKVQYCSRCAKQKSTPIYPTTSFKSFFYSGDLFTVDNKMAATGLITYSHGGKTEQYFIKLKYLDSSTSRYSKHDYQISFFADKKCTQEVKLSLMDGVGAYHSWEVYGNFFDYYNARDPVANAIYCDVRSSGKSYDKRLGKNFVTKKSEPVYLFFNEQFGGVFLLYEPDGPETMNITENTQKGSKQAIVRGKWNNWETYFKTKTKPTGPWSVKYNSTDDDTWVYDSLNELITFVSETDGEEFKKGISKYLDVDGMIDYMLTVYNIGAADNVGRSFTLATYDGKVWTPSMFDANASFGMDNDGEISTLEGVLSPSLKNDGTYSSDTNSLLWDKMLNNFYSEIKARYNQIKGKYFTPSYVYGKFQKQIAKVPKSALEKENGLYNVDTTTDLKQSIVNFVVTRKNIFEEFFKEKPKEESTSTSNTHTTSQVSTTTTPQN